MSSIKTKQGLPSPVTIRKKGGEESGSELQSPRQHDQHLVDEEHSSASASRLEDLETDRIPAKVSASPYRLQGIASRSLSSGSSVSESASISSGDDSTESSMATDATSRASDEPEQDDDEKSSGHTVIEQRQDNHEQVSMLQLAGAETGHSDSTRPTLSTLTSSPEWEVSFGKADPGAEQRFTAETVTLSTDNFLVLLPNLDNHPLIRLLRLPDPATTLSFQWRRNTLYTDTHEQSRHETIRWQQLPRLERCTAVITPDLVL